MLSLNIDMPKSQNNKRNYKNKKKIIKKQQKKQKGGLPADPTSGKVSVLAQDIGALISEIFHTVKYGAETVVKVVELPFDMGKAYSSPAAPKFSNVP